MLALLAEAGVDLDPTRHPGKTIFYHPSPSPNRGMFVVRGTLARTLDIIEREIAVLKEPTGQAAVPTQAAQFAPSPPTPNNAPSNGLSSPGIPAEHQPLYMRTFKINEDTLVEGLHVPMGPVVTNVSQEAYHAFLDYLSQAGVDLDPVRNPGKSIFYSDRSGLLLVRATLKDLDLIEAKIAKLRIAAGNEPPPGTVPQSPSSPATTNGSANPTEENVRASTLVQDGKLLYEMGKLDEAEAKLKLGPEERPA